MNPTFAQCRLAFLATAALLAAAPHASAADRLVPQGFSTIQAAINASTTGDRVLVSPGTYNESITFGGRRIRVQSTGGAGVTTINAAGLNRRVVQFTGGETAESVLDGFTIRGGNPVTGTLTGHGGGILICSSSRPTILNCVVRDNVAELGGGIYICLNSSGAQLGNVTVCNNLCGSGYGFDIAQGYVNLGGISECADCGCDPGPVAQWPAAQGGNGHWYQARMQPGWIGWEAARVDAESRGARLVCIETAAEQQHVASILRPYSIAYWVGLSQSTGAGEPASGWTWVNGVVPVFLGWGAGLPDNGNGNQHFGAMRLGGAWDDFRQDGETYSGRLGIRGWVLEWDADCNSDGVVDYGQILQGTLADADANGVPDVCQQPTCVNADIHRDFNVNGGDLGVLLFEWGPSTPTTRSDIDGDGTVDGTDLGLLLSFWGACP
jgi:hypothetical protein